MNRDSALYLLIGLVLGFVAAYPAFEAMSSRQPQLRPPGQALATDAAQPDAMAGGAPGGGGAGNGPAMEEIRRLREQVDANPNDAEAIRQLAQLNLQINDLVRARDLLDRYYQLRPNDMEGVLALANLNYDTKDFSRAAELYQRYLTSDPQNPDVLTDLGVSFRNIKQPQKALESFKKAQEIQPDHWVSLYNEVVVLAFDLNDLDGAESILSRLRQLQPGNTDIDQLAAEVAKRRSAA